MKVEQLLTEHKKGVKAVKYAKKPQPVVGPEAQKKKAKAKSAPPKTELEKHSKLKTTLEGKEKLSAQEKFKRGVKRAGYDMDAGAKRIEDLLAKQKKEREQREKQEKDMKEAKQPEAPKPRNFVAKNAKTVGAGKHKDAKKATKEVRGQKHKNKEMAEAAMGKVVDYKPGVSATIDTGPGMTTMLDLKKNPTSLTKDPSTGKLKLMPGTAATAQPSATTQSTVKPGDQVEMPKTNTMAAEDILRLAGLR